jgi:uncharacterized membrane protein
MKQKFKYIPKQFYTGQFIGAILDSYQRAASVINAIQFLVIIIMFYNTSALPFLQVHAPWVNFSIYMVFVVLMVVMIMVSTFMIAIPSSYGFFNNQVWEHNNPMRRKLEKIEKDVAEIKRMMCENPKK